MAVAPLATAATWTALAALALPVPARLARLVDQHPFAELAAAQELLRHHGPDTTLVWTYWAMGRHVPGLNLPPYAADSVGDLFEATAAIREIDRREGRRAYIVALTAHAMQGYRERCLEAGMDDYLSKPVRRPDLLVLLDRIASEPAPVAASAEGGQSS